MNIYLIFILAILSGSYLFSLVVEILNIKALRVELNKEFDGFYDADKYKKSQEYLRETTYFRLIQSGIFISISIGLIVSGGFNFIDRIARGFGLAEIPTGLVFAAIVFGGLQVLSLPFSAYRTFVIEEKYGFNRTQASTFITDTLKSWALTLVIGGIILSVIIWLFIRAGSLAWVACWAAVTFFQLFLLFIAPVAIMPLFNKFKPLENGELKTAIEEYAESQKFKMKGIYTMDGSRRSAKSNAFFTGFASFRRIVLFDTLIKAHTVPELVSVLAHEMGHYKKGHILRLIAQSILTTGLMFFILSLFIRSPGLFAAFRMQNISVYAGLFFFSFLYAPINMFLSIATNFFSRKYEYEADDYAVITYPEPEAFIMALKRLSVSNLSNLTPHRLKVFLDYTHPPVLKRIEAIRCKDISLT